MEPEPTTPDTIDVGPFTFNVDDARVALIRIREMDLSSYRQGGDVFSQLATALERTLPND